MAYIDDNNELTAGKGKDPIKELDDELEKLLAELKDIEVEDDPSDTPAAEESSEAADDASTKGSDGESDAEESIEDADDSADGEEDDDFDVDHPAVSDNTQTSGKSPESRSKAPVIIALLVIVGLVVGGWALFRNLSTRDNEENNDSTVSTETFTDSELGEVTVKKVDGAELNTYDAANLVKNKNGFYEYVVDGKVTSEVGVDLAEFQGTIDFAAVKKSGVDFVILRIGGRYYSQEGKMYTDGSFDAFYSQATAAGLKVGAYFYSQAITTDEAAEEAEYCIKKLDGKKLDYPIAFDWETIDDDTARTDNVSGATITAMAEKFCDTIEENGYRAMVYANTSLMLQSYDFETMKDYVFWLADYREFPNMYYGFAIWQYDKEGSVDGIEGNVDLNICFKPY